MSEADNLTKMITRQTCPRVKILVRLTHSEREQMKRLARAADLTLNDYLIKRGLMIDDSRATKGAVRERELCERAAFEIRSVAHTLKTLARRYANSQVTPRVCEKIEVALTDVIKAARCVSSDFGNELLPHHSELDKKG